MFYMIYYEKINNYCLNDRYINNKKKTCTFCLEDDSIDLFYDYNYKNNKYIHTCKCRPNIHYECFKKIIKNKSECIICHNIIITKKSDCLKYMMTFFKYSIFFVLLYELLSFLFFYSYNFIINFTYI